MTGTLIRLDDNHYVWACRACQSEVAKETRVRDALMILARLRDDEIEKFAHALVEADARTATPWLDHRK